MKSARLTLSTLFMPLSNANITTLHNYFCDRQEKVVEFTRSLVEIESPSGDEDGSRDIVSLLAETAQSIVGLQVEKLPAANYGEHLRITAFEDATEPSPIVLLGHTDTVHPRGSLAQRPWRVEDGKAYGPGVFDMKGSCALTLEIIRALRQLQMPPKHPLILLLTCDEETGSHKGRALVEAAARDARAVLVLEPPGAGGRVKTGRKGTGIFNISAQGRAAHAGLEPEKGASAVLELARQTERLHLLNDLSGGIRVNIGVFHGGTLSNVVPADAQIQVDVRFSTPDEAAYIDKEIRGLKPFDDRVQLVVSGGINRPPLGRTPEVLELYSAAAAIAGQLGCVLGETQVGGASDGNFAAAAGAAVLDGLGIEGDGAHAVHEHIVVDNIPFRGALLAGLIASLS
ncbi:MAG TPA: M20 family metallopeptidase [Pyrinomonadaceae bacterium]|nr:M20 family metallopeptidase [Pyrinomonadaceae bacterium]